MTYDHIWCIIEILQNDHLINLNETSRGKWIWERKSDIIDRNQDISDDKEDSWNAERFENDAETS